ncbi:DNA polymerase III subunit [Ignatzschineria indica]|uniref:DNA polymerase III subunit n=1 Tax=Ignatzschineria indica TaxID=472583 RepID=UPI002577C0D4|nr:DNA polymerase III subunit [Ignatzschineria indica]MDM1545434.1 DNA polymerase III subunit [Ignatzschineria indica]
MMKDEQKEMMDLIRFKEIPWLQAGYLDLMQRIESPYPPHALLIYGKSGVGKRYLVDALVNRILCQNPQDGHACGVCQSCRWLQSAFHPDLYIIAGESEIKVDDIRKIHHFAQLTPETGRKVVVIKQADRMNLNAANSLLKVLEEPPHDLLFLLESSEPEKLPITVRSRCQFYFVESPSEEDSLSYLQKQITGHYSLKEEQLRLLLAVTFDAPFLALNYLQQGYIEKLQPLQESLERLLLGETLPSRELTLLLETEALTFGFLFFLLRNSFDPTAGERFPTLAPLFLYLARLSPQFRLTQYEQLVEINRLREEQTRTDWALEAWFVSFFD